MSEAKDVWHDPIKPDADVSYVPILAIEKMRDVEKAHILYAYHVCKNNKTHTAKALGVGVRTVMRKLKKWGVP